MGVLFRCLVPALFLSSCTEDNLGERRSAANEKRKKQKVSCSIFSEGSCSGQAEKERTSSDRNETKGSARDILPAANKRDEDRRDQDVLNSNSPPTDQDQLTQDDSNDGDNLTQQTERPAPDVLSNIASKSLKLCSGGSTDHRFDRHRRLLHTQTRIVVKLFRQESNGNVDPEPYVYDPPETDLRSEIINRGKISSQFLNVPDGNYHAILCYEDKLATCGKDFIPFQNNVDPSQARVGNSGNNGIQAWPSDAAIGILDSFNTVTRPLTGLVGFSHSLLPWTGAIAIKDGKAEQQQTVTINHRVFANGWVNFTYTYDPRDFWVFYSYGANPAVEMTPAGVDPNQKVGECHGYYSPLIIDVGDQGFIDLSPPFPGTPFDINNDAHAELISWPRNEAAFLALDLNGNGLVDDGGELFGNHTSLSSGRTAANGFAALGQYDSNGDQFIDDQDPVFAKLLLWTDRNQDGISQTKELLPIARSQIEYIDIDHEEIDETDAYGNKTLQRSVVGLHDGQRRLIFDIWFRRQ